MQVPGLPHQSAFAFKILEAKVTENMSYKNLHDFVLQSTGKGCTQWLNYLLMLSFVSSDL